MSDDKKAIRDLLAARDHAIAQADAEAAVATTAEGAVSYDLQPPLAYTHAHDAAVDGLNAWFATWRDGVTSDLKSPTVLVSGDLAVAYGLTNMRGDKAGEGPTDLWFRSTVVLERRADGWLIVQEHSSVPLAMDGSGRAVTDLKPE